MVIEERQRRAHGEAVQPQRHLGQLDGHGVLVHPVDAALEHHAPDDGLVGELGLVQGPAGFLGSAQDLAANRRHARHQRRLVRAVEPLRDDGRVLDQVGDVVGQEVDGGDEEVAAAHGRVEHLEIEHGLGRVQLAQLGLAVGPGAAVALELVRLVLERLQALLRQRFQRSIDDQVDELLRGVEAAAVLARVWIGADDDRAVVAADRRPFQETLVDGAELLDGHVAVVDEAPSAARLGVAQVVDDRRHGRVGQTGRFQQRRGVRREQSAVVGRQADGGVALVDQLAERHQVVVVARGVDREGVAVGHPARDVVAHALAQAVVVVAGVVDRQQAAIFRIEHEEQSIEQHQRRLPDLREVRAAEVRERLDQAREGALEHDGRLGPARPAARNAALRPAPPPGRWSRPPLAA